MSVAVTQLPSSAAIPERSSFRFRCILKDADEQPVPLTDVTAIYLTLRDMKSGTIVNSRSATPVLNTNGGTLHATTGAFAWLGGPDDSAIVGTKKSEQRSLTLDIRTTGSGRGTHQTRFYVENLEDIT